MGDRTNDELLRRRESAEKAIDSGSIVIFDRYDFQHHTYLKMGVCFEEEQETEIECGRDFDNTTFTKVLIGRNGNRGNFFEQNHPQDVIFDIDEILRLRDENEKLRAQVEGLKECVGFATLQTSFPNIPKESLMALGKSMMKDVDIDQFLAGWKTSAMKKDGMASPQEVERFVQFENLVEKIVELKKNKGTA